MPQKRKQTPDMPQSPPKRVTRARAKKDVDAKLDTTRVMTPSAKASVQKKSTAQPAKNLKSKMQPAIDDTTQPEAISMDDQPDEEAPKTRSTMKAAAKTSSKAPATSSAAPAKSTRSRTNNPTLTTSEEAQVPKPKGRPKRTATNEVPTAAEKPAEPELPMKTTRGRPAAAISKPPSTRTRAAAAPKKKVKFDDQSEQDKENQPLVADMQKKPEAKATGLRAKPIRKPATAKAGVKGTNAKQQQTKVDDTLKENMLPLSPKKVTQIAKTPSVGSEDELAADKTPLKALSISPSKIPVHVGRDLHPALSDLEIKEDDVPRSPQKDTSPGRLATSPRKPPPSPFKDALKSSPRKIDLGSRPAQPKFDAPSSPIKSPLKESPKRVNLDGLRVQPVLQWSKTPLKSSLLQSPARRMGGSSMKMPSVFSPSKNIAMSADAKSTRGPEKDDVFELPSLVTESAASSPLRAAKSPGQNVKVLSPAKEKGIATEVDISNFEPTKEPGIEAIEEATPSKEAPTVPKLEEGHVETSEDIVLESPAAKAVQGHDILVPDVRNDPWLNAKEDPDGHDQHIDERSQLGDTTVCDFESTPLPMKAPDRFTRPKFILSSSMIAADVDESESEDELASPHKEVSLSPLKTFGISAKDFGISAKDFGTPSAISPQQRPDMSGKPVRSSTRRSQRYSTAMTPLALQMSSWLAESPEKKTGNQVRLKRGIFSPFNPTPPVQNGQSPNKSVGGSPAKPCFFEDEMAVRDAEDAVAVREEYSVEDQQGYQDDYHVDLQASQELHEYETYGDENQAPQEPEVLVFEQKEPNHALTCTPARVFEQQNREIHTVSKVPLRPAADDSPLVVPRKRSRSFAGPLSDISMPDRLSISRDSILSPILQDRNPSMSMLPGDPKITTESPETPVASKLVGSNTPGRSTRKVGYSSVLRGAIVHVDVHTTEGADASGIFVDLLTQMGARCVKQWHWNPQGSLPNTLGESPVQKGSPEVGTPNSKVGITHVVYKDGGKRTLEKVREARGAVVCVGVGWVLDCEREDKWLDENDYAVDTSIVPRGGSRRRKSMEPRALANLNGSLVPAETPAKGPPAEISPTKEFLNFDTPASRRETFEFQVQTLATPIAETAPNDEVGNDFDSPLSPTTPYYLSKGAKLVQQTCPPKQSQELFFPVSGKIEDQPNEAVRQRLLMARRKSLQWASKIQSPLGRTVSYGK
ncbi:MAG: hypothetical protein Q9170_006373 [Blastenia crenularia]